MLKYAKVINEETKLCDVGLGTNENVYKSIGFKKMEVEQAYNEKWYLKGYAPEKPKPTIDEIKQLRAEAYLLEVDPITAQIQRLRDEEVVPEGEIETLIALRTAKVTEIKMRYPYCEVQDVAKE